MMEIAALQQLIRWLEEAGIASFEIEGIDCHLRLSLRQGEDSAGPISVAIDRGQDNEAGEGILVAATLPGTFLIRHPLSSGPLVPLGGRVRAGDIVGLVQVGSIYAPVTAPGDGSLDRILAAPETLVGFGTPLFEIRLSAKAA